MKLLYKTAEWHALAKLQMHFESTLDLLDELTIEFEKLMRQFCELTCSQLQTVELPREVAARHRRQTKAQANVASASSLVDPAVRVGASATQHLAETQPSSSTNAPNSNPQPQPQQQCTNSSSVKLLELLTVEFHFLGDHVRDIRLYGTTDSYPTQLVWHLNLP